MKARLKRVRHAAEYGGVRAAFAMTRWLPPRVARGIGAALGWLAWSVFRVRRRVAMDNITAALGDGVDAAGVGRRSYANLGRSLMEFTAFSRLSHEDVRAMARLEGLEHLDAALAAGRGAVLFAGHFGNWELLGAGIAARGYPIHFLVGEQTNRRVDARMNELRRAQGIGIISRRVALKKVLRALRENQFVALLADQDARRGGVFVDFLGRPAATARGPAMFAIRQGAPVVCAFIRREAGGGHVGVLEAPLYPDPRRSGDDQVRDLIRRYTDRLGEHVRRHPEEYFWGHRRWKTQPPAPS